METQQQTEKKVENKEKIEKKIKDKGGRPSKLTRKWLKTAEKIINRNFNALVLTDEDLFQLINLELPEKSRITDRTFKGWKAGNLSRKYKKLMDSFFILLKKSFLKQKEELFLLLRSDKSAWQRWAWIIERKFPEWNIRQQFDLKGKVDKKVIFELVNYDEVQSGGKDGKNPDPS